MRIRFSRHHKLTTLACLFISNLALAGGGGAPADPGPNPNPSIADVPGNKVQNGNFEQIDATVGERNNHPLNDVGWRGWDMYQRIPYWFTSFGAGIEVQRSAAVYPVTTYGGGQYIELASDTNGTDAVNSWMTQRIPNLTTGQQYLLQFVYHRNPNTSSEQDRGIAVYWGKHIPGKLACIANASNAENAWKDISCNMTATGNTMYLTFASFGEESTTTWGNGVGGLIDIVRLTQAP